MRHPLLYEINTRCWLRELSQKASAPITLGSVPDSEFANWKRLGLTHIWLMGVWTSGPLARAEGLRSPEQRQAYSEALPDWSESDVDGSPYAIADYRVPATLGGDQGLATFRRKLNAHGIKLILDFVPNHLGLDHPWINEFPDVFVQATVGIAEDREGLFSRETKYGMRLFAHGKDPNFPAWTDTIQLDYRMPETHAKMLEILQSLAARCDGVRCDMAMLILPQVFTQTWSRFPPTQYAIRNTRYATPPVTKRQQPETLKSFWSHAIPSIKSHNPDFLFLAEAYWNLEPQLQAQGFDFTYDKELYDRLVARDAAGVQRHLLQQLGSTQKPATLDRGAHFLENHDERRIASVLSPAEHRAAALVILGLPGMRFLHEGQLIGARCRLPVQLTRRCDETAVPEVVQIYEQLLTALQGTSIGQGRAELLKPHPAWTENPTAENFILIQWQSDAETFDLVVVNLAAHQGQCYVPLTIANLSDHEWHVRDLLSNDTFTRSGADLQSRGLYLDLPSNAACLFRFTR